MIFSSYCQFRLKYRHRHENMCPVARRTPPPLWTVPIFKCARGKCASGSCMLKKPPPPPLRASNKCGGGGGQVIVASFGSAYGILVLTKNSYLVFLHMIACMYEINAPIIGGHWEIMHFKWAHLNSNAPGPGRNDRRCSTFAPFVCAFPKPWNT